MDDASTRMVLSLARTPPDFASEDYLDCGRGQADPDFEAELRLPAVVVAAPGDPTRPRALADAWKT